MRFFTMFLTGIFLITSCATLNPTPPLGVPRVKVVGEGIEAEICEKKCKKGWCDSKEEKMCNQLEEIRQLEDEGVIKIEDKEPDWIIETKFEGEALAGGGIRWYLVASILDVSTGKKVETWGYSLREILQKKVDSSEPNLKYEPRLRKTTSETLSLLVEAEDNLSMKRINVFKNGVLIRSLSPSEPATYLGGEVSIPLDYGENEIAISAYDWLGNETEEKFKITRTKLVGEEGIVSPPPSLEFSTVSLDGDNAIVGGNEEGIIVTVKNKGNGIARAVRVVLSGDEFLVNKLGKTKEIGDIKPGQSKHVVFSATMPTEIPGKKVRIYVSVQEGRGYSPTERHLMEFTLVPPEVKTVVKEMIENVDHNIPRGRIEGGNGYALIIGISKYLNVPAPKYARKDAEAFEKYASRTFGITNIRTLYDEQASASQIKGNLTEWLRRNRGFKIIYFAGHGIPDPENPASGQVYLLPYDGNPDLKSTLISLKEIQTLGAVEGDTVLVFLDACFSGGGRSVLLATRNVEVTKLEASKNAIIFAAAEGSQPAKEFEEAGHGYFTYYTLLGLRGKADLNGDRIITTMELYNFVREKVRNATNNVQIPVLNPQRDFRILRLY
jgi:hypothetical protein